MICFTTSHSIMDATFNLTSNNQTITPLPSTTIGPWTKWHSFGTPGCLWALKGGSWKTGGWHVAHHSVTHGWILHSNGTIPPFWIWNAALQTRVCGKPPGYRRRTKNCFKTTSPSSCFFFNTEIYRLMVKFKILPEVVLIWIHFRTLPTLITLFW